MIEPILSLTFSMHANRGVYAVLLGSGVSRAAGIPTGWEVVIDLIRKIAHLQNADCEPDPAAWYRNAFGVDPTYSELLGSICKSPAERLKLLRSYFEPTDQERADGIKSYTTAHEAIANLAASGHVRVVITTNFDRLLEHAMTSIGVSPTVLASPDAVDGSLPLSHMQTTIFKVHGDYLDTRIKNSPVELDTYDERVDRLLDRVLDEFGLIVCGWSAEWDTALRAALERCSTHRFTTYWCTRGDPSEVAERLIALRRAETIRIGDADSFFQELNEKLTSLDELDKPHPLSAALAVEALKRYLEEPHYRIRLHDLVMRESDEVYQQLISSTAFRLDVGIVPQELATRMADYETVTETLRSLLANGCFWGGLDQADVWVKSIRRVASYAQPMGGQSIWLNLMLYPTLVSFYTAGIACVSSGNYDTLNSLVNMSLPYRGAEYSAATVLNPVGVVSLDVLRRLPGMERLIVPISERLFTTVRASFLSLIQSDGDFERAFDRFEYLFALIYADLEVLAGGHIWGPVGRYAYRQQIFAETQGEIDEQGRDWPPLRAGLFGGSLDRLQSVKAPWDGRSREGYRSIN